MPIYTYKCPECGTEEDAFSSVEDRNKPIPCLNPECSTLNKRRKFQPAAHSIEGRAYIYRGDPNSWFD